jgi:outer membrane protein
MESFLELGTGHLRQIFEYDFEIGFREMIFSFGSLLGRMFTPVSRALSFSGSHVVCLVFACGVCGTPCSAEEMTLETSLTLAYSTNPQLEAQRASLRATDEEVAKALAGWRPTIAATGSYGLSRQNGTLLGLPTGNTDPQSDQLTLTQPLFDGRTIPGVRHAKALVEVGRAQLSATEQTVLGNAATAYFAVLRDTQIVDAYHDDIDRLRAILTNAQERLKLGDLTKTDVSQASARLLASQLNLEAAQQQLSTSRQSFEHLVGRPPETLQEHILPSIPDSEDDALKTALSQSPALLQSEAQEKAADYAVDTAFGALLPSFSIQGQYGRTVDQVAPGIKENGVTVVAQLSIPIYQGGAEEAAVRGAKEQRTQATFQIADAERQVKETLATAWTALVAAKSEAALATEQADQDKTAYEGSIMESQVGARTTIDILNAEQELQQSRVTAITENENGKAAAYQLLAAMGEMTAEKLKLPVTLYNPQEHYDEDAASWFGFGD